MPDVTAQASTFRSRAGYHYNAHLAVVPQTAVMDRAVNMASITYPVTTITFDDQYTGAGAYTDIKEGMTVIVYNGNSSTVKGYLRVATGGASSTVLQVNEFSQAYLNLADNDKFAVLDHYLMWDLLVAANAALDKDSRVTYSAQLDDMNPVANGGGAWAGDLDSGAAVATIEFDWTTSFPVDPDNSSGLTYSVDVGDGNITVGSTTTSTCTVEFPAGFRHVELTVTDADSSATHVKQIPVYVDDPASRTSLSVATETLESAMGTYFWRVVFSCPLGSEASLTNIPDGSFIIIWESEHYGATNASYGSSTPTDRSHIKFCGYLVRDTIRIEPESDTVTFEAVGPLGVLEMVGALPQLLVSDATPANWQEIETLTLRRALWYVVYWHSTALRYFDFIWPSIPAALTYQRLAIQDTSSIAGQLRDIGDSAAWDVVCDRQGVIRFLKKPPQLTVAERATRGTTYNVTVADLLSLDFTREHQFMTKLVTGEGITSGGDPVFSKAPGNAPGPGTSSETLSRQVVADQDEMNQRTGDHLAWLNGTYYNSSTKQNSLVPKSARFQMPDKYDWADPAHREFYTLTLAASLNKRGVAFTTSTLWTLEGVTITYDPETGTKQIDWQMRPETKGLPGTTFVPPSEGLTGIPALPEFDLQFPDLGDFSFEFPGFDIGLNPAIGTIAAFNIDGNVYFTTAAADFSTPSASGGPQWTSVDLTGLATPLAGTLRDFVVDAYSPGYTGTTDGAINGWIVTTTNIYRITDIFSTGAGIALTDQHTFTTGNATMYRSIDASYGVENWVMVISRDDSPAEIECAYTTDGSTWAEVTITSAVGTVNPSNPTQGLHISSRNAGLAYAVGYVGLVGYLYRTLDYGATWTRVTPLVQLTSAAGPTGHALIHAPFDDNNDQLVFASGWTAGSNSLNNQRLYVVNSVGSTGSTNISPATGAGPSLYQRGLTTLGSNRQLVVMLPYVDAANHFSDLWVSTTGGETAAKWSLITEDVPYQSVALVGDAGSKKAYLWGLDNQIGYSEDITTGVIDDRSGDLASSGRIVNICGRGA